MTGAITIASYPRSGSTWLRFVLCNLLYPNMASMGYAEVNYLAPPLDDPKGLAIGCPAASVYKTHALIDDPCAVLLHRHVGDVLESEWWYKKKMWDEKRSLPEYLEATEYGKEWREHVDHYRSAPFKISYKEIGLPETYRAWLGAGTAQTVLALHKSHFNKMQEKEKDGFGIYPSGDPNINFCRSGKSGNWNRWPLRMQDELLELNKPQLTDLGYA